MGGKYNYDYDDYDEDNDNDCKSHCRHNMDLIRIVSSSYRIG